MSAGLQVHRPATLAQALAVLHEQPQARPVGGGTELVTLMRSGLAPHTTLVTMATAGLGVEMLGAVLPARSNPRR